MTFIPFTIRGLTVEGCKLYLRNMGASVRERTVEDESTPGALFICFYGNTKYAPVSLSQAQEVCHDVEQKYYNHQEGR